MNRASAAVTQITSPDSRQTAASRTHLLGRVVQLNDYREPAKTTASDPGISRPWQVAALRKICGFFELEDGWDSYQAKPVKLETGMFALQILNDLMKPGMPEPSIVPSSVGGIQMEWHTKKHDLEIHIAAPYDCEIWFSDNESGDTYEAPVVDDFSELTVRMESLALGLKYR